MQEFPERLTGAFAPQACTVISTQNSIEVGVLDLSYSSSALRRICKNKNAAIKELGSTTARLLHARLSDISAAETGSDLKLLQGIFTLHDESGAVTSSSGATLVLRAEQGHLTAPRNSFGQIDWAEVLRLKVLSVGEQR